MPNLQIYQSCWLITAIVFFLVSLFFRIRDKKTLSLLLLTIGGFAAYMFAASLFPFINTWDEQYHALVAKNMMQHPFTPMLYDTDWVNGHDYYNWAGAHIWLHKQPLFLWQIALSFKIFGVSELSLRLPAVLMCTLLIPIGYRIAQLLTNSRIAYFTAIAITCSWFLARLTSGLEPVEQNDVCFIFYVCASVWAFCEYLHRRNSGKTGLWKWAIVIGLCSGAAILTKWLTGLLIYLIWGFYLLFEYKFRLKQWKIHHLFLALGITMLVVVPWQLYIFHRFPDIAAYEFKFNFLHLHSAIENHQEPPLFFLMILPYQYFGHGSGFCAKSFQWNFSTISSYLILLVGLIFFLRTVSQKSHKLTILATLLFVYLFFSIATTKMPAYTFIVCLIWFMSIGTLCEKIELLFRHYVPMAFARKVFFILLCAAAGYYQLDFSELNKGMPDYVRNNATHNKLLFIQLNNRLPEKCYIFGANGYDGTRHSWTLGVFGTFYSNRQCYAELPSMQVIDDLQRKGFAVAIFDSPFLPPEYKDRDDLLFISEQLIMP